MRLLVLPYCPELAERLYAFSIGGRDLVSLDYEAVRFVSGINEHSLPRDLWQRMVSELGLKPQPFQADKWRELQRRQEALLERATKVQLTANDVRNELGSAQGSASSGSALVEQLHGEVAEQGNAVRKL